MNSAIGSRLGVLHPRIESTRMRRTLRSGRSRSGQALVEYALVIALVGVGLSFALLSLRNSIGNSYNSASNSIAQGSTCAYGVACASTPSNENGNGNGNGHGNGNGNGNGGGNGNGNGSNNGGGNGNGNNGNGGGRKN